jgi:hypothetical protein
MKRKPKLTAAPTIKSPLACRVHWIAEQAIQLRLTGDVGGGLIIAPPSPGRLPVNSSTAEVKVPTRRASEFARESWLWEQMARLGLKAKDVEQQAATREPDDDRVNPRQSGSECALDPLIRNNPEKSKTSKDKVLNKNRRKINDLANLAPVAVPEINSPTNESAPPLPLKSEA